MYEPYIPKELFNNTMLYDIIFLLVASKEK
jgi:hypothetical protein